MSDKEERAAITAAMSRLLAGTPLRSSGRLDIVTLAIEAGLKRNKLTHKHKDLKDLFYAQVKAQTASPTAKSSSATRSPP
ncbi:hypothetical protein [Nonomuraea sp. NPDC049400]|uniref:hypothetical protein n=1 Tax=Nonomuraea sp. NPDC049400 TaxID=3364352 RepID=UPI00378FCE25